MPVRPRPRRPRGLLALLALAPLLAPAPRAATAQDARPGVFGETLEVRVVDVEVVVTDRDGARVRGLGPEDFELTVDGSAVAIEFFTEVVGGVAAEAAATPAGAQPQLGRGEPLGVSWLVFIDDYFSIGRDRDEVLDALRAQLGSLGTADRMAIVAWDGRQLEMLTSWTGSVPALERAIDAAQQRRARGLERLAEWRSVDTDRQLRRSAGFDTRRSPLDSRRFDLDERHAVDQLADQVKRGVTAASAALRAFANPPGRKALLLLAGGWPWDPARFLLDEPGRLITSEERAPHGDDLFGPLADTANRLGYTIYPVDVPGLDREVVDASSGAPRDPRAFVDRELEVHAALSRMAEATGGRELINSARVDVLSKPLEDTRSFYWLGFTPRWQGDDSSHRVGVEVRRPGLRVRFREGFRDLSRTAEVSMAVESSLLFGNPPSTAALQLAVGPPESMRGRRMRVPIEVMVPTSELTAVPTGDAWVVAAELRVAAQDEEGRTAPVPVVPLELRLERPPVAGESARYRTTLELRRVTHDLVVALYEPASGKLFSATARVIP
jgi:VWFA-related protein